ncbi:MAG TPA: PLP-dependent aminotransferase family protein [Polyangiaceae bacterium]|nr:PLP-dependent aminotransferase family protein [Polyangiaceae bacterium]
MATTGFGAPSVDERDALARKAAKTPGLISFAGGLPDPKLFPTRDLGRALEGALNDNTSEALQYGWPEGSAALREYVARELRARGARVNADGVVMTSGAQQAIALALAMLPRGAAVGVDPESYPGALEIFRAARRVLCDLTEATRGFYVMPSVSNPRGQRLNTAEREALLSRAAKHRGFIIEDDAYEGTWFSGEGSTPLLAEAPERVFQVGTFSKTLCPGLRIGWLVPPPALLRRALQQKQADDLQANSLAQALLVRYLEGERFEHHKRTARQRYRRKARALARSVAARLPELRFRPPGGGFSLWLESDLQLDQKRLLATAIEAKVSFDPGYAFRFRPSGSFAIRLCYSAVAEDDIDEGVRRLARALAACRRKRRG